jgi:hypothetical protein
MYLSDQHCEDEESPTNGMLSELTWIVNNIKILNPDIRKIHLESFQQLGYRIAIMLTPLSRAVSS